MDEAGPSVGKALELWGRLQDATSKEINNTRKCFFIT